MLIYPYIKVPLRLLKILSVLKFKILLTYSSVFVVACLND
ncbi:MAG: hypothetical protein JWQ34_857 [Mucilaginibacter sp.]|nr:hypothetical protein [Mucilaginibacter sp.]